MSLTDKEFMRYNRHVMLEQIGEVGQNKFKSAHVLVIGMGGLGCPSSLYLAASGIGTLTIIDHDEVELSNLQRQVLYTSDDVGTKKVTAASSRLSKLNPHCDVHPVDKSIFDLELDVLFDDVDIVLDCTDSAKTRRFINEAAVQAGVKLVSASAIQGAGQLVSFDFSLPNSPCYACMFPEDAEQNLNCSTSGVFSPLLGVMGSLQATEALRLLLGKSEHLNKLTLFDAWGMEVRKFNVTKDNECDVCSWR